jgi:protein kinase A
VLLDGDGHVRLIDFGNAKRLPEARGHRTYTVCGTLDYLAPV